MFKKRSVFILAALLVVATLVLVGCTGEEVEETDASLLEDGEYVGYSQASARGYVEALVTIEGDEIVAVELTEYQLQPGEAKGEDYHYEAWHEAMDILPDSFVEANDSEVDIVSGATSTTNMSMEAVDMALQKAQGVTEFDGTYAAFTDKNERGSHFVAWVTVEDGDIIEVELNESRDGEYKPDDYQHEAYNEARVEQAARKVSANSADVDVYSGATGSSNGWIEAAELALEKAGLK
ncbi:FMN-binding protein [Natroniella sp. ANB-PHB2]|uniref:FMN-binding protein n=1 Tax=Natroniella sp. ANB-PHB2 TaxID=3384444 RepID=UPI0038D35445